MSNYLSKEEKKVIQTKVYQAAAKMFLERGYSHTTTRALAEAAGVNVSTMNREFGSKENILCGLVQYVLDGQFSTAWKLIRGITEDMVIFYAVETAMQLHMAESSEAVRDLYLTAYSLAHSSELIHKAVSNELLPKAFGTYLPEYDPQRYYELEIASGSIIRGYIGVPCSPEFTMEQKIARFLDVALRIYRVPEEKIRESIEFVKQFDMETIARNTIDSMLSALEDPEQSERLLLAMTHGNHLPKEETI